jgi:hypothetical protein
VTTCHCDHGRHRDGACHVQGRVTAPGHGGHGAGHSNHGDGEFRNPRRRPSRPLKQRLSPGRAGGTKAELHLVDSALPDVARFSMLRSIYMQSHVPISRLWTHSRILVNMVQPDSVSVPSPGRLSHPRARHYRRYLEVVLLAMLRDYLLPTPRVDRYRGRSPAWMRPDEAMTHLVRGGLSSGLAGLGRTGLNCNLSGSFLPVPHGPGPAIFPARPLERLGRAGHPLARPAAMGSCR